MKISVSETKDNPLMKRKEVKAVIMHEGGATPSRFEILKEASKALKANKDNIVINKVLGIKGIDRSEVKITVYNDKKDIPKALAEKMARRMKAPKAEEKPVEEAAPAKAPAKSKAPSEEKKEEPKAEEKKEETKEEKPKAEEKKEKAKE